MTFKNVQLLIIGLLMYSGVKSQDASLLVYLQDGRLAYESFAMTGRTNAVNTIPDFSHAGYKGGGVAIPTDIPIKATIQPEPGDDTDRIQAAIDVVAGLEADQNGFKGAVLLKAGHYSIESFLLIRSSGVVLRGEGQGLNGTLLHANRRDEHSVISILGGGSISTDIASEQVITTAYVPVGSSTFEVADPSAYQVGDQITILRTPSENWINELGMDQETLCEGKAGCTGWTTSGYTIDHERTITDITNNTITVDIPIVDVVEQAFGGGRIRKVVSSRRISNCGIENLRVMSFYNAEADEEHAWTAVRVDDAENCWVRNVTGQYLAYSTVNIENANFVTVQECAYIDPKSSITGGRRYSFAIQNGLGNLFQRCYAKTGRHDFVTGSRVTGPNVFLDGLAEDARSDIGPHHRWATGTLFDNIGGASTRVWNRGNSGSGHGWSGAQTMFWNIDSYGGEFRVDSPLGSINWGIGCRGTNQTGDGYWESWGNSVTPRSLYLQQLQDRLGDAAVESITIPEQRSGDIYTILSAWAGQGQFARGGVIGMSPSVSFTNPTGLIDVATWQASDIIIDARDSDGTVSSVQLLINGEPVAVATKGPFVFDDLKETIQGLPHTLHYMQAIATDNDGNTAITRIAIMGGDPPMEEEMEEEEEVISAISVYPIPSFGEALNIQMIEQGTYEVEVFDVSGRPVQAFAFEGKFRTGLDRTLENGLYVLQIRNETGLLFTRKIVIN